MREKKLSSTFILVAVNASLDTINEYFRISTNLLGISDRIYNLVNDTSFTLAFCAIRCESDGEVDCKFFLFENGVCFLGDWKKDIYTVHTFEFGYAVAYYRQSEFNLFVFCH